MKNTAKNKGQVLAALALAFVLGVIAMPGVAFAEENVVNDDVAEEVPAEATSANNVVADEESNIGETEGDEGGISPLAEGSEVSGGANAEGDGAGDSEGETKEEVSEDVAENLVELYNRIQSRESFATYRKVQTIMSDLLIISDATQSSEAQIAALAEARTELAALLPEAEGIDEMGAEDLAKTLKMVPDYEEYADLAMESILLNTKLFQKSGASAIAINKATLDQYLTEAELMTIYGDTAQAALAIDDTVMDGLMAYELPKTSAPEVETPNTGANDGLVEGSLDLVMVTLVASATLATLAGAGVLARLYLHRKF